MELARKLADAELSDRKELVRGINRARKLTEDETIAQRVGETLEQLNEALDGGKAKKVNAAIGRTRTLVQKLFPVTQEEDVKELSWPKKVAACETKEDFLWLFAEEGLSEEQWSNSGFLQRNRYMSLSQALSSHFQGLDNFKRFMGLEAKIPWTERVTACETREQLLALFATEGLTEDQWSNSNWLAANRAGLRSALRNRFIEWDNFKRFMGLEKKMPLIKKVAKIPWTARVASCETRKQLLALFVEEGLTEDQWSNSRWLGENKPGLKSALQKRFKKMDNFQKFMGLEAKIPWTERVTACETREQLLALFAQEDLTEQQWSNSRWLNKNGYSALQQALDKRFDGWDNFKKFIGLEVKDGWPRRIISYKTREDFLSLFAEEQLTEEQWSDSQYLNLNGYSGLCSAISNKFDGWRNFKIFMDVKSQKEDEEFIQISHLNLEQAIAFFRNQEGGEAKLKMYLQFAHSHLSEDEINKLIIRSFRGLYGNDAQDKEGQYLQWPEMIADPTLKTEIPEQTQEPTITIQGSAPGAQHVFLSGTWNRRVRVQNDGTFSVTIPLKIGSENAVRIMGVQTEEKTRSEQLCFEIEQTGQVEDISALIQLLGALGDTLARQISVDPGRKEFFAQCTEKLLIKKFSRSFKDGEVYVKQLRKKTKNKVILEVLDRVLSNFQWINNMQFPNVKEGELMFFQKYCVYKIREAINSGKKGINLCSDPGLGKTRTIWAALADQEVSVFAPNTVVSAWEEEAEKCLEDPDLLVLDDGSHAKRKDALRSGTNRRMVTNVQFLQQTGDKERFELVSGEHTVVVHDEAHSRKNEHSEQSKGAKMLKHKFAINVTATLARNPVELRRMLHTLDPDKAEFSSDEAFRKAFPSDDSKALTRLKLILDQYTLRFRKHEVMEEIDPKLALEEQLHRLPKKERVSPDTIGSFEMTEKQADSLYAMFVNWSAWCRKYGKYIPKDQVHEDDGLRTSDGFAKMHAYRQTINNPEFINDRSGEDAKAWQMERIVRKCLKEGRKVVIFCRYEAQAQKYAERFAKHQPSLYTGRTAGCKEKRMYKGKIMSALDYERHTFQDLPERKILISTYAAGSVGSTFTAGKATIYDDLPADCKEDIQAEDRTHRIDPHHQTHAAVQYYQLQARYPKRFLERMKQKWVRKQDDGTWEEYKRKGEPKQDDESPWITAYEAFFEQGTYDQVQGENLRNQRVMFHLINDGIADESALEADEKKFEGLGNGN